ncbi:peptidoglycan-binding domain-containing protein [Aquabacterium humicola]|uniref:peptidoglycan-binding domain-containing protein n=1 Tax=Aquabacterium humicola TaxID=3237377 RepID=UPI002542CC8D|nr:peptidoglycan-binding domain-containing protein [Rubrivivax pictus]
MARQHVVQAGDCIASIGFLHGFLPDTIWNDAANGSLRAQRRDGNVLAPGDVVTVPDPHPKHCACATDRRHVFRRRGVPELLRLQFLRGGRPRVGLAYELWVDGQLSTGTTDDEGRIVVHIPPAAREATLMLGAHERFRLQLGGLEPSEEASGARRRLVNLGLLDSEDSGTEGFARALRRFQRRHGLAITGSLDEATGHALRDVHGA